MAIRKDLTPEQSAALHSRFSAATRWLNGMVEALQSRGFDETDLLRVAARRAALAMEEARAATLDANAKIRTPPPLSPFNARDVHNDESPDGHDDEALDPAALDLRSLHDAT